MDFLNFLTQRTSLLNFNFSNLTSGLGFGNSELSQTAPAQIHQEPTEKEHSLVKPDPEDKIKETEPKEGNGKDCQVELFTKQQQLINQYMHLNIQLLSKKL